ncbi:MAG: DUF6544 family protein [Saprospiraceae bacterium]|nr:DUF6544 family protein [Saprospiraceae bacterium]
MVRAIFIFILLVHGLIHLKGFAKAFKLADIQRLTHPISKTSGVLWLLSTLLFIITATLFILKKDAWWMVAIPAIILSQIMIIISWQDAKFGTIANIIIIIGIIFAWAIWDFNKTAQKEVNILLSKANFDTGIIIKDHIISLPPIVQKWLERSGIIDKPYIQTVYLQQKGEMRTTPDGKWMPVNAEQYFTSDPPGFVWIADVNMMPILHLSGIDTYQNGKGRMLIKVLSLVPIVNATGTETDQGTMLRYLAEMIWFPSAALNHYITWEKLDVNSAKATMNYNGVIASGIFTFSNNGDVISFEADRYYNRKSGATLERWYIENSKYDIFNDIRIPIKSEVTWKLKEGDFTWYKLEITDITYNQR